MVRLMNQSFPDAACKCFGKTVSEGKLAGCKSVRLAAFGSALVNPSTKQRTRYVLGPGADMLDDWPANSPFQVKADEPSTAWIREVIGFESVRHEDIVPLVEERLHPNISNPRKNI